MKRLNTLTWSHFCMLVFCLLYLSFSSSFHFFRLFSMWDNQVKVVHFQSKSLVLVPDSIITSSCTDYESFADKWTKQHHTRTFHTTSRTSFMHILSIRHKATTAKQLWAWDVQSKSICFSLFHSLDLKFAGNCPQMMASLFSFVVLAGFLVWP